VEDARDAEARVGVRARPDGVAAWATRPDSGRSYRRSSCPDHVVDGAYRELRATVERGLAFRTGSSDLAEDLTQDVFVDLLLAARCRPPANTRAWLARVAQRRVADTIGSAVRERAARARLEASDRALKCSGEADHDTGLAIEACLAHLPAQQRQIIVLRLQQGLSFAGCGVLLGMSEDAARMRFRRALPALRRELGRAGVASR
jgi:RNA polymerase sigma-70 factor (ECF subfamily)